MASVLHIELIATNDLNEALPKRVVQQCEQSSMDCVAPYAPPNGAPCHDVPTETYNPYFLLHAQLAT
jgi:hypothetical protein